MSSSSNPVNTPPVVILASGNNIVINPLQRGNPVLECIRNVGKEFGDIVADYQVGRTTGVLYLSYEEAGHYLTTFKQFEFKPPDMIKERVDKDYHSILRTTLTSISKVNKTDVETLRTSFGSFANIAKATPDQLQNLPGFGQVKVKNIKNAFEKPFRNQATSSLASQGKKAVPAALAPSASSSSSRPPQQRPPREPSPAWDIESDLDLN
ncbi:hypothetical protein NLJ89_g3918 [Agrocybe chaxingu]|uniref:ERCC1-like central domain-containing protein n=1 Tax=Agrocybe chaxingu TaxID=84603 RepID=A0A9W8K3V1_9AGAR|nr:hypothetical protein NLJ89_g3918 [Agrocybe chaxingu]